MLIALVAALLAAGPVPASDPVVIKLIEKMKRPLPPPDPSSLARFEKLLGGRVTDTDTSTILDYLAIMPQDEFLATLSALESKKWKSNRSLFDKFIRRGVDDRATFLAEFAEQLNSKLELGLTPLSDLYQARLKRMGYKGTNSEHRRATRQSNRQMVQASKNLYKYLGLKDELGRKRAVNSMATGLKSAGIAVGAVVAAPIWVPIFLLLGKEFFF